MTEFRLLSNFVFESADTAACVAKIQQYIDEHSTDTITYKRFPVDDEDELRLKSGLIDVLLSPNQAKHHPFPYNKPVFSMSLESSEICQYNGEERLSKFLDLVSLVYNTTNPLYVFGMLSYRLDAIGVIDMEQSKVKHEIDKLKQKGEVFEPSTDYLVTT